MFSQQTAGKKKNAKKKHWHQTGNGAVAMDTAVNIEEVNMEDLADALDIS